MTALRQRLIDDLHLRSYAERTVDTYVAIVALPLATRAAEPGCIPSRPPCLPNGRTEHPRRVGLLRRRATGIFPPRRRAPAGRSPSTHSKGGRSRRSRRIEFNWRFLPAATRGKNLYYVRLTARLEPRLRLLRDGERNVAVGGLVICRQRPGTANGSSSYRSRTRPAS